MSLKLWSRLSVLPNFGENILIFLPLVKQEYSDETVALLNVSGGKSLGILRLSEWETIFTLFVCPEIEIDWPA